MSTLPEMGKILRLTDIIVATEGFSLGAIVIVDLVGDWSVAALAIANLTKDEVAPQVRSLQVADSTVHCALTPATHYAGTPAGGPLSRARARGRNPTSNGATDHQELFANPRCVGYPWAHGKRRVDGRAVGAVAALAPAAVGTDWSPGEGPSPGPLDRPHRGALARPARALRPLADGRDALLPLGQGRRPRRQLSRIPAAR
jgi:hypothetical protein